MYAEDEESIIDGVDNAKEHAKYLKSALTLGEIQVVSIGDFGFGKGILLKEMAKEFKPKRIILDLGICNSIFQYIPTDKVSFAFAKLSRLCRYVYFSVPTKVDYEYMKKELDFIDPYAHVRDKKFYLKSISPHFTIVSLNLLESKVYNRESGFLYEFFRF